MPLLPEAVARIGRRSRRRAAAALFAVAAYALLPAAAVGAGLAELSPGLVADLSSKSPDAAYTALVHFNAGSGAERIALVEGFGFRVVAELRAIDVLVVSGRLGRLSSLASHPWVSYIEDNAQLQYYGSTALWASRVGVVRSAAGGGPYRDAGGNILDGNGLAVAIVDSGVDATHPDLAHRVVTNWKAALGEDLGPGSHTDHSSGHGTHVSGIVAGDGTASRGTFRGVAPGAKLHVFSSGEALSVAFAVISLEEIYDNYSAYSPPIRVVNNSWGNPAGSKYSPGGAVERLVKKLVQDKGVTVVFAAGNSGGNGNGDATSGYCKDPTPGVICVANYDDNETGDRDFALDGSSSRGKNDQPDTYPDISAPGAFITSTFMPTSGALYGSFVFPDPAWQPYYGDAGGTSMAAPHLSGIVAMLLQAKPTLTPAEVEDILVDSAHKFTAGAPYVPDPQNPDGTTSFDKGAGLVDAPAALADARVKVAGQNAASPTLLASGDGGDYPVWGAADIVSVTASPSAGGITYSVGIRAADDRPPVNVGLRVTANVDGRARRTTVNLTPAGQVVPLAAESPSDNPETAEASWATRNGNTVTFFVSYHELGDPAPGSPAHNAFASTFIGAIQDVAPSPMPPSTGLDVFLRPLYGPAFTVN